MARNKYPEETVKRILDAALELFLEKGYEHTSIQDIIDRLGNLTKGAIYHHFKSKEDILLAVMERLYGNHDDNWLTLLRDDSGMTGLEKLRKLFRISITNPGQLEMFKSGPNMMENPKMLVMQMRSIMESTAPRFVRPLIDEGIADGSIQTDYPQQLAEVILLLINLWVTPMVFDADTHVILDRLAFFRRLTEGVGLDLFDEPTLARFEELLHLYKTHR